MNKGFAFVQFTNKEDAEKAIKELNGSKYKGRTIAVDFSVPKDKYVENLNKVAE